MNDFIKSFKFFCGSKNFCGYIFSVWLTIFIRLGTKKTDYVSFNFFRRNHKLFTCIIGYVNGNSQLLKETGNSGFTTTYTSSKTYYLHRFTTNCILFSLSLTLFTSAGFCTTCASKYPSLGISFLKSTTTLKAVGLILSKSFKLT